MANKTLNEKCNTQLKTGNIQETQNNLTNKLKLNLEKDILRLFRDSLYCDIKLVVNSSSILTHSCILRTRACRFYKFIYTEFEVLIQNGISIFNIYNSSFTHLQSFVENIYTNIHSSTAEDRIIKHLKEAKINYSLENKTENSLKSAITPDSESFFTPKSSPSELQKPFATSKLKIKENNVASYYKIVSVDDITVDEGNRTNEDFEDKILEKELAEQDELLSSFQTIFSKESKNKSNCVSLASQSTKKSKPKLGRRYESNVLVCEDQVNKVRNRQPLWKPNPVRGDSSLRRGKNSKNIPFHTKSGERIESNLEEGGNSSDMDASTTGADSGLDNSSICQPETSPRENTVSETSGVDLTEAAIHEDIPNDETISTKQVGTPESSASSEMGTWDDFKRKTTNSNLQTPRLSETATTGGSLNEDEMTRLDEMERNISDCEIFLYMERQGCQASEECKVKDLNNSKNSVDDRLEDERVVAHQYANEENEMSNRKEFSPVDTEHRLNDNDETHSRVNGPNDDDEDDDNNNNVEGLDEGNDSPRREQGASDDVISTPGFVDVFGETLNRAEVQETKTPPCTPKKLKVESPKKETEAKEVKTCGNGGVSNYFIDASSLLDDDEIISPPISLINFKSLNNCEVAEEPKVGNEEEEEVEESKVVAPRSPPTTTTTTTTTTKRVVTNFFTPEEQETSSFLKENERRQGDLIFKNSIPHYSKHEFDGNVAWDSAERLRGGADHYTKENVDDDGEQVVPSFSFDSNPTNSLVGYDKDVPEVSLCEADSTAKSEPGTTDDSREEKEVSKESHGVSPEAESVKDVTSSSAVFMGSPSWRRRNESAPILSGGMDFVEEKKVQRKPSQSQGEAWIVTFDDNKKPRNKLLSSGSSAEVESNGENGEERNTPPVRRNRKNEPSVEFFVDLGERREQQEKPESKVVPLEKSSSFGYFLDLGKKDEEEEVEKVENKTEKRNNMFSMFIGMNEDSKSTFSRKPKSAPERERTSDKSQNDSPSGRSDSTECPEEVKKSFYMFIESDSPNVRRKQGFKKPFRVSSETAGENPHKKGFLRTESYTIEREEGEVKGEAKTDFEYSSSDNSLPYSESDVKMLREKHPGNKFRGFGNESKVTAWAETKEPECDSFSGESWLRTKDIQVNYTGKGDEDAGLKKDSTFIMRNKYKGKNAEKYQYVSLKESLREPGETSKTPERDSGVILSEKSDDSFVKLSDLDSSDSLRTKQQQQQQQQQQPAPVRMSQSVSEMGSRKDENEGELDSNQTRSSSGLYNGQISHSLSRLFPNLSAHSLASLSKKDGVGQTSETSEVSSSLQSSVEPCALEISTSETDVSTHVGTSSRLGEDLLKMFLEEISPDVVIEIRGRRIKAHKCILSSRCQYFAAMLSGGWVESAGNVISLQGFSYNAVHFALRHIYSGESRIPESLNIVELATLADMLCLDGLQEIISYNLKVKYCHSFHVPCSVCSVGVIDCLPIAAAYGLDDLYRKCLRWITKYFVKIWPTKKFSYLPRGVLEKCYQHYVVHLTVDNVLDTIVNIDKVRGSLPNVRWAETITRLVNKLHNATVRYIAEHFSSVLTSDNFLALGKEAGWSVSRLEDSLIETIKYLPPEQACWSHARLHRILSVATGPDPPQEMTWNENFIKLLQTIAELVENSLIKQAPRAAKSKAWRQMEPELRSRIQEAACLVLPNEEPSSGQRRTSQPKRESSQPSIPQTAKSRNLELKQIKLAMSQQVSRSSNPSRPLSLQIDQRPKKDSRFVPLRPSASTSSVRKPEPREPIRKTQSRSQILSSTISEPKKSTNPRYSDIKSRYLEPRSPQKSLSDKANADSNQRRTFKYVSSSDSSRNCSPALRHSNSRASVPQVRKANTANVDRRSVDSMFRSDSTSTIDSKRDRSFVSTRSDASSVKTLSRLTTEENMSTDSLASEKELLTPRRESRTMGKENAGGRRKGINTAGNAIKSKSNTSSPTTKRLNTENWSSGNSKMAGVRKYIGSNSKTVAETKSTIPLSKRLSSGRIPPAPSSHQVKSNSLTSPRPVSAYRNQRNVASKCDGNLVNGNTIRSRKEVDSENNRRNSKDSTSLPSAVSRSGTFLKDEPTILKKPQAETVES